MAPVIYLMNEGDCMKIASQMELSLLKCESIMNPHHEIQQLPAPLPPKNKTQFTLTDMSHWG